MSLYFTYPKASLPKVLDRLKKVDLSSPVSTEIAIINMGYTSMNNAAADTLKSAVLYGLITIDENGFMTATEAGKQILTGVASYETLHQAAFNPESFYWISSALTMNNGPGIFSKRSEVLEAINKHRLTSYNAQHCTTSYYNTIQYLCKENERAKHKRIS